VAGIAAILAGLVLSLTGSGASAEFVVSIATRVVLSLVLAVLVSAVLLRYLPRLPMARRLILSGGLGTVEGYASAPPEDLQWLGKRGHATSPLRPAGIATIDGKRVDVISEGDLIEPGQPIQVVRVDGNRIVVRPASTDRKE
jgi:membrane-bound serine protease (ClpP class)